MTIEKARKVGLLAQQRGKPEPVQPPEKPLIWQAIEQMDGMTYPRFGAQLIMYAHPSYKKALMMGREIHAGTPHKVVTILSKGGK